jgi:signal transduction histidine kinase
MRLLLIGIVFIGLVALASWTVLDARRATATNAIQAADNLAGALGHDIQRNIDIYDLSLQAVVEGLKTPGIWALDPKTRNSILFDGAASAEDLGAILVVDANGEISINSRSERPSNENLSAKDYFRAQRDRPDAGLFVSAPYISVPYKGAPSGEWSIAFSRRVDNADGSFAGIVVGSMRLQYFKQLFDGVELGTESLVTLFAADGTLVMRHPYVESYIGKNMGSVNLFDHFPRSRSGSYEATGRIDGVKRLYVYEGLGELPLVLSVAQATDTVFAQWKQKTVLAVGTLLGLLGIAAFLTWMLRDELRRSARAEKRAGDSEQRYRRVAEDEERARTALQFSMTQLEAASHEQKRTEIALAASERRFRDIASSCGDWFWELDRDHRFTFYTRNASESVSPSHLDLSPAIGRTLWDWAGIDPESNESWQRFKDTLDSHRQFMRFHYSIVDSRGKLLHISTSGIPVFNDDGSFRGYRGTSFNITSTIEARRRSEQAEILLDHTQRIARIGGIERDMKTGRVACSENLYDILGVGRDFEPTPDNLIGLVHPDDRARMAATIDDLSRGIPHPRMQYRIVRPDGAIRYLHSEDEIAFEAGEPVRIVSVVQDVTELRESQEREHDLERQLLHSQKLEALGTLAGGIAHDLNNILTPIMGLSKIAARRFRADDPIRANLDTIFQASEQGRDLVHRILAFSRKGEVEKQWLDARDVVNEALELLRATLPSSICLEARIASVPAIWADASQIHQVVTNLVSNAAQAIGSEMGSITVVLERDPDTTAPGGIVLTVSDTGKGMDEETQQRIFEPFFTTKLVGQGTGLGLSIVHGVVVGHGGRIDIESAVGKGTRFILHFPLQAAADAPRSGDAISRRPAA